MKGNLILKQPDYSGNNHVLNVDGNNDYMSCGATPNLHFSRANIGTHGVTINVWYYAKGGGSPGGQGPLVTIGGAGGASNDYYGIQVGVNNASAMYMHTLGNSTSPGSGFQQRNTRVTSTTVPTSQWNMITYVFTDADQYNWKIYLNGVQQALNACGFTTACGTSTTSPVYYSSPVTTIGWNGRIAGTDYIDSGYIGDIGIWKKGLSASAIASLHSVATAAPNTNGVDLLSPNVYYLQADALELAAWWRMGDPYGSDTYPWINDDWSVNGDDTRYTATMTNMASNDIVTSSLWG
jgi:hypothetical protein